MFLLSSSLSLPGDYGDKGDPDEDIQMATPPNAAQDARRVRRGTQHQGRTEEDEELHPHISINPRRPQWLDHLPPAHVRVTTNANVPTTLDINFSALNIGDTHPPSSISTDRRRNTRTRDSPGRLASRNSTPADLIDYSPPGASPLPPFRFLDMVDEGDASSDGTSVVHQEQLPPAPEVFGANRKPSATTTTSRTALGSTHAIHPPELSRYAKRLAALGNTNAVQGSRQSGSHSSAEIRLPQQPTLPYNPAVQTRDTHTGSPRTRGMGNAVRRANIQATSDTMTSATPSTVTTTGGSPPSCICGGEQAAADASRSVSPDGKYI